MDGKSYYKILKLNLEFKRWNTENLRKGCLWKIL